MIFKLPAKGRRTGIFKWPPKVDLVHLTMPATASAAAVTERVSFGSQVRSGQVYYSAKV
jgi:hypothetical protein